MNIHRSSLPGGTAEWLARAHRAPPAQVLSTKSIAFFRDNGVLLKSKKGCRQWDGDEETETEIEREGGKRKRGEGCSHRQGAHGPQRRRRLLKDSVRQPPQLAWAPGPMELRVVKGRTSNNALKVDGVRTGWVACVVAAMAVACIKEYSVGGMMCAVRCSNGW